MNPDPLDPFVELNWATYDGHLLRRMDRNPHGPYLVEIDTVCLDPNYASATVLRERSKVYDGTFSLCPMCAHEHLTRRTEDAA